MISAVDQSSVFTTSGRAAPAQSSIGTVPLASALPRAPRALHTMATGVLHPACGIYRETNGESFKKIFC